MQRLACILCVWILFTFFQLSEAFAAPERFPKSWVGSYVGHCTLTPPFNGVSRITARYRIAPLAGSSTSYRWELTYNLEVDPEIRPYELLTVDAAKGHYLLDEKNGILMDHYYSGGVLRSTFTVSGRMLTITEELSGSTLKMEILSYEMNPVRSSGGRGGVPVVNSYGLDSIQRCEMKRVPNR